MKVLIQENYGIIKVQDSKTNQPLPKVYVKCFMKDKSGTDSFYKDGYTDIRGSFDYARLNVDKLAKIDKFSILVCDDERGLIVKQCGIPSTMGKFEESTLLGSSWKKLQQEKLSVLKWE